MARPAYYSRHDGPRTHRQAMTTLVFLALTLGLILIAALH